MSNKYTAIVVGGGPAGLTAANELIEQSIAPIVFEQDRRVGGIARTEEYKGYRFDIGGHRFYTKVKEVEELWHSILNDDFRKRPRLSRIYYNGKFFYYPLRIYSTLIKLGPVESLRIIASYLSAKTHSILFGMKEADTLEEWICDRFGIRLYRTFFKTYTEKVWGIPCNQIRAEWAAQRIQGMSLRVAILNALTNGRFQTKSLIDEFEYPVYGPGMMWEALQERICQEDGQVFLNSTVTQFKKSGNRIQSVTVENGSETNEYEAEYFISSMPVSALIHRIDPAPPYHVLNAAARLKYRDFLIVGLILDRAETFPDNWIYVHDPGVQVGRIQNFKNWSPEMVPDQSKTSLGMEYFCNESDALWQMENSELVALASREMEKLGLADAQDVIDGCVIRQRKAYPVYDGEYRQHLTVIQEYLATIENLQTIGRNGLHRYNNQDHSMLTGLLAARNLVGGANNLWEVNTERSYYEEFQVKPESENSTVEYQNSQNEIE